MVAVGLLHMLHPGWASHTPDARAQGGDGGSLKVVKISEALRAQVRLSAVSSQEGHPFPRPQLFWPHCGFDACVSCTLKWPASFRVSAMSQAIATLLEDKTCRVHWEISSGDHH